VRWLYGTPSPDTPPYGLLPNKSESSGTPGENSPGFSCIICARERHAPMVVEVDHACVVSLRPEARRRDVPVARLVECATVWVILAKGANL
jgi:hypothetical protein